MIRPKLMINGLLVTHERPRGIPSDPNPICDEIDFYFVYRSGGIELHGEVAHGEFLGDEIWAITLRYPDGTDARSPGVVGDNSDAIQWLTGEPFQTYLERYRS